MYAHLISEFPLFCLTTLGRLNSRSIIRQGLTTNAQTGNGLSRSWNTTTTGVHVTVVQGQQDDLELGRVKVISLIPLVHYLHFLQRMHDKSNLDLWEREKLTTLLSFLCYTGVTFHLTFCGSPGFIVIYIYICGLYNVERYPFPCARSQSNYFSTPAGRTDLIIIRRIFRSEVGMRRV